jgi:ABC-type multidrug transport system fused ATPase/permease subunit
MSVFLTVPGSVDRARARERQPAKPTLAGLFLAHRWKVLFTYALFTLENLIGLTQPLVLGRAINGLLAGMVGGLVLLIAQHLLFVAIGGLRRAYDTRLFTRIYGELASRMVTEQRAAGVEVSRVAARSALSREMVAFLERDLPFMLHVIYGVAGALLMLLLSEWRLAPLCLAVLAPAAALGIVHARKTARLNGQLHDELEREVGVINGGATGEVALHFERLAQRRIGLSDWDAMQFGCMQGLVLTLMAMALALGGSAGANAGHIALLLGYVSVFSTGVINLPTLVEQFTRLRDIGRRVRAD